MDFGPAGRDTRDGAVIGCHESKREVGGVADADSWGYLDWAGLPVVLAQLQLRVRIEKVEAIVGGPGDVECLAEAARASG